MNLNRIRLGTRGSKLALIQAHTIQQLLQSRDPEVTVEIVPIKTSGDRGNREILGSFVKEIQEALLRDEIDVALHCLKDLPTRPIEGLVFAAYLKREDPTDSLISRELSFSHLPKGGVVGTGSIRRTSQLSALRSDLKFKPLVGNIDTRIRKLQEGEYDAIVLASAGLERLGVLKDWETSEFRSLKLEELPILPAAGQAILILETKTDSVVRKWIDPLNDSDTQCVGMAERSFLSFFGTGCSLPVAAHATVSGSDLKLEGLVAATDGSTLLRGSQTGPNGEPIELGRSLAARLCDQGARDLLPEVSA